MLRAYKYRLYPSAEQELLLAKHFGCCRMVYNLALEVKQSAYSGTKTSLGYNALSKQLSELKQEYTFLNEINSQSLQTALRNLDTAYQNFFKGRGKFPNFKKKSSKQSFGCPQNVTADFDKSVISLPKFRTGIPAVFHRRFKGTVKTVTISRTPSGKYFTSILVDTKIDTPIPKLIASKTTVGIDLGLKSFLVTSDGFTYDHPKYLKQSEARLKVLSRRLSRKRKGSNRRLKAKKRVAVLHDKISNQRTNFLHKVSSEITNSFDTVCMEDLKVSNMVKNHKLSKSISDSGWGMFTGMVKYKCEWKGKNFLKVNTFFPSSKTCSTCSAVNDLLTLADREWLCAACGTLHDRDVNAGKNIKAQALKKSGQELSVERMELPALAGTMKCEKLNIL